MKLFRVKADGTVEPFWNWRRMDGTAYVSAGGLRTPYVIVSRGLADLEQVEGRIERASFEPLYGGRMVEMVPEREDECVDALAFVPSGGFTFDDGAFVKGINPQDPLTARLVLLHPGQTFGAFPVCRTLAECRRAQRAVLSYDGSNISFG